KAVPAPVNIYGQSKRAGEEAVLAAGCQAFILRTAWVYSAAGQGFLSRLLAPHRLEGPLHVEAEQVSSPSWAAEVGNAVMRIAQLVLSEPGRAENIAGIYHVAGGGAASRYEFAEEAYAWLHAHQPSLTLPSLCAAPGLSFDAPARRPLYTALDSSRAKDRLGVEMPGWRAQLHACLEALYT
ncbi:MAG: sugar nucleotide-binding protein, partial [Alphaproteobacteria bacterium]|nr:sugar nucleotide-binding protein [Alphaproteobacteria bacterium]